jgi:hypothetical protein
VKPSHMLRRTGPGWASSRLLPAFDRLEDEIWTRMRAGHVARPTARVLGSRSGAGPSLPGTPRMVPRCGRTSRQRPTDVMVPRASGAERAGHHVVPSWPASHHCRSTPMRRGSPGQQLTSARRPDTALQVTPAEAARPSAKKSAPTVPSRRPPARFRDCGGRLVVG